MTRDYSAEIHGAVMQIYKDFDILIKIVGDCRKELNAEADRKAKLMEDFDKIQERKNESEVAHHNV